MLSFSPIELKRKRGGERRCGWEQVDSQGKKRGKTGPCVQHLVRLLPISRGEGGKLGKKNDGEEEKNVREHISKEKCSSSPLWDRKRGELGKIGGKREKKGHGRCGHV